MSILLKLKQLEEGQVVDSTVPSTDTASINTLFSNLANRIKAITGEANWKNDPDVSLATIFTWGPHAGLYVPIANVSGTAGRIPKFTAAGAIGNSILEEVSGIIRVTGTRQIDLNSTNGRITFKGESTSWSNSVTFNSTDELVPIRFGAFGTGTAINYAYIGSEYNTQTVDFATSGTKLTRFYGNVEFNEYLYRRGGTTSSESIRLSSGLMYMYVNGNAIGWDGGKLYPLNDNARDLGSNSNRWKALYTSSDANIGGNAVIAGSVTWGAANNIGNYRNAVIGYSSSQYGGIGYNLSFQPGSATHNAVVADHSSLMRFDTGGFVFLGTTAVGTGGAAITWTELLNVKNGTFTYKTNNILHAGNYNTYSPTLTGTGATGTWGISVTGNSGTATILQTARTINGTSFNGSANITTSLWGTSRTITIGSTGKAVDGSANVSWSLGEIGAAASSHTHTTANITDLGSYTGFDSRYLQLTGGTMDSGSVINITGTSKLRVGHPYMVFTGNDSGGYNVWGQNAIAKDGGSLEVYQTGSDGYGAVVNSYFYGLRYYTATGSVTSGTTISFGSSYVFGVSKAGAGYFASNLDVTGTITTGSHGTSSNWNTAFGWGNHASAGYLTTALAASTYVTLAGSYANPSWITSLAWGKITGAPAFITGNQTITLSGDATGSGTTAITVTLANSGVAAGTYNNVATQVRPFTVDAKGRITAIGAAVTITPDWANITGKPSTFTPSAHTHTTSDITNLSSYTGLDVRYYTETESDARYFQLTGGTVTGASTFRSTVLINDGTTSSTVQFGINTTNSSYLYKLIFNTSGILEVGNAVRVGNVSPTTTGIYSSFGPTGFSWVYQDTPTPANNYNVNMGLVNVSGNYGFEFGHNRASTDSTFTFYAPASTLAILRFRINTTVASRIFSTASNLVVEVGGNTAMQFGNSGGTMYGNWGGATYFSAAQLVSTSTVSATTNYIVEAGYGLSSTSAGVGTKAGSLIANNNANSAYGQFTLNTNQTSAWIGFNWNISSRQPHFMFLGGSSNPTGYGDGGLYYQNPGRWAFYYNYLNDCLGVGGSTTSSTYKLYVSGGIYATGDIVAFSDERGKKNITKIEGALDKILKLRGVSYYLKDSEKESMGVIAQEVLKVVPQLVNYTKESDTYGVKYGNFVGLFIEAFKEQEAKIKKLEAEIKVLKGE